MGHHKENDDLREERVEQDERRNEHREKALEEATNDGDFGSQDERRDEGLPSL